MLRTRYPFAPARVRSAGPHDFEERVHVVSVSSVPFPVRSEDESPGRAQPKIVPALEIDAFEPFDGVWRIV